MRKFKLQVMTNEDLVCRIDAVAEKLSMSRSSLCNFLIAQGVYAFEKSMSATDDLTSILISNITKSVGFPTDEK